MRDYKGQRNCPATKFEQKNSLRHGCISLCGYTGVYAISSERSRPVYIFELKPSDIGLVPLLYPYFLPMSIISVLVRCGSGHKSKCVIFYIDIKKILDK